MHKKEPNKDVTLADMHDDGVHFTENLLAKKERKEREKEKIERMKKDQE
ncbi:hypothetical protein ACFQ1M_10545 [Sungkyunkwania multivorans]|uniref:Uncharacterized protein n=1 Tax=Sungkyunkwania multivorans TaxID=1173618 RepID=A0ABW3D003_9FLAO